MEQPYRLTDTMARKEKFILNHALLVIHIWFAVTSGKLMYNQYNLFVILSLTKLNITCKNMIHGPTNDNNFAKSVSVVGNCNNSSQNSKHYHKKQKAVF